MLDRSSPTLLASGRQAGAEHSASTAIPGVLLPLRRHQRVPLMPKTADHIFVVVSGVVMVEARLPERDRQVLEILYQGDVFHTQDTPDQIGAALVAATPAELQRYRLEVVEAIEGTNPGFRRRIDAAMVQRSARRTLHLASMSGANGEERLADFLVEIGLHLGREAQGAAGVGGRSFDMPLSREEIADYLALNPDTLSRMFSRFKSSGLIAISRGRATVPDWSALTRLSPLANAQTELRAQDPANL